MSRRLVALLLPLALTSAAQAQEGLPLPPLGPPPSATPAAREGAGPFGLEAPLQGLWRVHGKDRRAGPFTGFVRFLADNSATRYTYRRTLDLPGGARGGLAASERGLARLTGGHIHTRQDPDGVRPGLIDALSASGARPVGRPLRHGFYRLADRDRAPGFFLVPETGQGGPEQLTRVGPDAPNNRVQLLVDGGEFFPMLREELEAARRSISVQTFIFTGDSTGRSLVQILCRKAREGVRVRVLIDRVGATLGDDLERQLQACGAELIVQHGYGEGLGESVKNIGRGIWDAIKRGFGHEPAPREQRGIFNHDHRKITVIDGRVGFIGGMNLAREYEEEWHDVHARVEGNAVRELEALFFERWRAAGGEGEPAEPDPDTQRDTYWPGDMDVDVVASLPGLSTAIRSRYLREIRGARRTIHIEVAYFLDDAVIGALKRQARRGVDALVIVPNDDDHDVKIVRDAFNWSQNDFIRSGAKLYKYQDRMVHSKVATFDGRVATVGSSNLDTLALEKLSEANIFVNDAGFTRTLEQRVIQADVPRSERVEIEELSWWQKVKGGVLHFFRGFL